VGVVPPGVVPPGVERGKNVAKIASPSFTILWENEAHRALLSPPVSLLVLDISARFDDISAPLLPVLDLFYLRFGSPVLVREAEVITVGHSVVRHRFYTFSPECGEQAALRGGTVNTVYTRPRS